MSAPYSGRCACGAVTATIAGEPVGTRQCWCRQCQQIAGGGPTHNAIFRAEDVRIEGPLASNAWRAASGNTLTSWFCPACGTPVYGQSSARPQFKTVRLGLLDEGHGVRPQTAIWTDDAPDWALIDPQLERFAGQPPAPPIQD
jgi:hypothetical protein